MFIILLLAYWCLYGAVPKLSVPCWDTSSKDHSILRVYIEGPLFGEVTISSRAATITTTEIAEPKHIACPVGLLERKLWDMGGCQNYDPLFGVP